MEEYCRADSISKKSRSSRMLSRVAHIPTSTKSQLHKQSRDKVNEDYSFAKCCSWQQMSGKSATTTEMEMKNRAGLVIQAFIAKLFASASSIKAAYAELQLAQFPYNSSAILAADDAIVAELRQLSEMKRSFAKKQIDLSPQVALLLAMAQEQQSMMSTYELTLRKLEAESKAKDEETASFKSQLGESLSSVKAMETRLNSSGALSILHGVELRDLTCSHFSQALHYALRCVRSFAKVLAREIELAEWDLDLAVKSIAPRVALQKQSHRIYAVESFVNRVMFAGFNGGSRAREHSWKTRRERFEEFEKLRSSNPKFHLAQNPGSEFGAFLRSKYVNLVHPEMERSLFGNVHQRSAVSSGQLPDTEFFTVFGEMVKRVWLLNLLSMSFHSQVSAFQVAPGCRFSEVYMESASEEEFVTAETCVGFTVAPGFHVCGTVVQCLVYLSAPPVNRRSTRGQSS